MADFGISDVMKLASNFKQVVDIIKIYGMKNDVSQSDTAQNLNTYHSNLGKFCVDKNLTTSAVVSKLINYMTHYQLKDSLYRMGILDLKKSASVVTEWVKAYQTNRSFANLISALPNTTINEGAVTLTAGANTINSGDNDALFQNATLTASGSTANNVTVTSNTNVILENVSSEGIVNLEIKGSSTSVKPNVTLSGVTLENATSFKITGSEVSLTDVIVKDNA